MIAIADVQYEGDRASGGMVLLNDWPDDKPVSTFTNSIENCEPYQPGMFFKRELPVLLDILSRTTEQPTTILIDAYVDIQPGEPGLGRYLFDSLNNPGTHPCKIIGVAKSRFRESDHAIEILRGSSVRPLFVTAAGTDNATAAECIMKMQGANRIPQMIKLADTLARQGILNS